MVCRATSFHRESGSAGEIKGTQSYTRDKVVRERRRINAGQTSVTMYTYEARKGDPRTRLPRGESGCVNPGNIRTYAPTSIDEPSPDPRGLIFRTDIH